VLLNQESSAGNKASSKALQAEGRVAQGRAQASRCASSGSCRSKAGP
jgi:hypothetical protein